MTHTDVQKARHKVGAEITSSLLSMCKNFDRNGDTSSGGGSSAAETVVEEECDVNEREQCFGMTVRSGAGPDRRIHPPIRLSFFCVWETRGHCWRGYSLILIPILILILTLTLTLTLILQRRPLGGCTAFCFPPNPC